MPEQVITRIGDAQRFKGDAEGAADNYRAWMEKAAALAKATCVCRKPRPA